MKHLLLITVLFLFLAGCGRRPHIDRQMDEAENICVDRPREALQILERIDTTVLTEPQKARRALLQAYIGVTWRIAIDIPEGDLKRVMTRFDTDCSVAGVRALIVKSEVANGQGNPVERIERLKDAEFLAVQLDDKTDLAYICLYLSQVYINGFNGTVSRHYAAKARQLFDLLGHNKQSIDARMAVANTLTDPAAMLDSLKAMREEVLAFATDSYKAFYQDQLARAMYATGRPDEAIRCWEQLYSNGAPNSNTLAHWAQAYADINRLDSAEVLIERAIALPHNPADEYLCRNVQHDIWQRLGRTAELPRIDSLREQAGGMDHQNRQLENISLAINLKNESAIQTAWADLQASRQKTTVILLMAVILVMAFSFGMLYYRKRMRLLTIEHENDMLRIQRIQTDLFEKEHCHDSLTERIALLFKSRFDVIDKLAITYFECKETSVEQKRIHSETKALIMDFGGPESLLKLEGLLNASREDLMKHFDADFPNISKAQRKLALFIFCGLSLQSISVFMDADIRNLYVYKSRLKSTISRSNAARRDLYLQYFG